MADGDLAVRFTGDASQLNATINAARQSIASFSPGVTTAAVAGLAALADAISRTRAQSDQTQSSFLKMSAAMTVGTLAADAIKGTFKLAADAIEDTAKATIVLAETANRIPDILVAASEAIGRYYQQTALAARGDRLFEQSNGSMRVAIGNTILGIHQMIAAINLQGEGTTQAAMAAIAAAGNYDKLTGAVMASGDQFGSVTEIVDRYIESLAAIPDMSKDAAVAIESMIATIPNYSIDANDLIITWLQQVSRTAADAQTNVKALVSTFSSPTGGGDLANMLTAGIDFNNLDTAKGKLEDIAKLASQFRKNFSDTSQEAAFFDALIAKTNDLAKAAKQYLDDRTTGAREAIGLMFQEDQIGEDLASGFRAQEAAQNDLNASLARGVAEWKLMADQAKQVLAAQKSIKDFQATLDAASTPSSQLKELQDKIDQLQKQPLSVNDEGKVVSRAAPGTDLNISDDEQDLAIRTIMGEAGGDGPRAEVAVANVLQNRLNSGRYGDSLFDVLQPSQFDSLKPSDPTGALSADPTSYAYAQAKAAYMKVFDGKDSAFLAGAGDIDDDITKGATHFLNPAQATDFSWYPTMTNKSTFGHQEFGNTPDSPPVLSDDNETKRREDLQQSNQLAQQLKDTEAGGTAEVQSQLALAQQRATQDVTDVQAAQAKVDAAKKQLELNGQIVADGKVATADDMKATEAKRTENATAYYDAVAALRTAQEKAAIDHASAQEQTAMASARAAGDVSDVKAAQMRLDAAKQMLTITGQSVGAGGKVQTDPGKQDVASDDQRKQAAVAYYEAVAGLRAADLAQDKAVNDLKVAQAQEGSQAQLKQKIAGIEAEETAAKGDVKRLAELEQEKVEAIRQADKQVAASAAETETASYNAAKRALDDKMAAVKTAQSEGSLSDLQALNETKSIQNQELDLEQAYLEAVIKIWAKFPNEYRRYQLQLANIAAERRSQDLNAENKYQEEIVNSYKQHMDQIASTISSSLSAIIERTGNWRDLLRNIAKSVEQQFISSSLKMAADWAVDRTKDVAVTVATQAQSTAAVMSGNAAREASTIASDAQAAVSAARSFAATIAADAKATFAGVFAFLSPVMGPLAAGPAAGAAATVASYDVGAWSLPADQLAMVHQNEMIIPAGPAQAFRDAVAGGGGAGGGNSVSFGDVHVHNPRNVDDFVSQLTQPSNLRRIGRAVATMTKTGL